MTNFYRLATSVFHHVSLKIVTLLRFSSEKISEGHAPPSLCLCYFNPFYDTSYPVASHRRATAWRISDIPAVIALPHP
jgi:hypothetical protein